jgi:general secretion pathway protein D
MKRLLTCTLLILALPSFAQFSKYKSRTKFNNARGENAEGKAPSINIPDTPSRSERSNNTDAFGRSTSQGTSAIRKDKNYVNLNPETAFGPEVITSFNFPDTSLTDLTKQMQKLTGINLILDKEVKGKVSILAPSPITVGDAWKAYLTALEMNGLTLVQSGSFWKVVSTRDIRYTPTKIYTGNYTPNTDNYVMRIIPLKNIDSSDVMRSFRPFMSRYGRILDIKQTNTLIVQDTGSNINRLVRLVKFIDVPGHDETLQIIPVKHSSAQEIANLLDEILKGSSRGSSRGSKSKFRGSQGSQDISRIIAEPRTNTIIAMANAQGAKRLRELILKLDVKDISRNGGRVHVYYLNHGDSETLAKTLSSLVSGAQQSSSRRSSRRTLSRRSSSSSPVNGLFSAEVKITADKENNALVVTASPTDYLTLKEVIAKLDIARDQVYVEGLMMETQVSKARGFGVSVMGVYGSGNARKVGFTQGGNDGLVSLLTNQITSLGGLFAGIGIGKTVNVEVGGQNIAVNTINGLITAIANNGSTNVLATPQILALDNSEAIFEVGESIPTPETATAASGTTTTSIKQQKVGMTLKITPQINKVTRFVKLKIEQKMQDFSNRPLPSGLQSQGVATVERNTNTTVVVRDKDTIAMGGLMRDRETMTESKVPLLGDIPVLGWLFKNRQRQVEKVNLLFFLTPRILASYQKDNANQVQDLLNRRSGHLKNTLGEDDPFGTTVKGLYEKAKKQEEGPLYDDNDRTQFRDTNESDGIQGGNDEIELSDRLAPPNYMDIVQKIDRKAAAPVRVQKIEANE